MSCFLANIKANMIRRKRDRLGVSFAKQLVMKRFLARLRRFGPRPPERVWSQPRSKHILTALKGLPGQEISQFGLVDHG